MTVYWASGHFRFSVYLQETSEKFELTCKPERLASFSKEKVLQMVREFVASLGFHGEQRTRKLVFSREVRATWCS